MFINPKTDYAFKKIFGSSESKDILISFLNALIYDANPTIVDLEIVQPKRSPIAVGEKDTYLDVKARLCDETFAIVEIQVLNVPYLSKQVMYNTAEAYAFQLQPKEGYRMLQPVISLTITDLDLLPESESPISHFVYKEKTHNSTYSDNSMELVFVELSKFSKEMSQLETLTDKWIYFLKYARSLTRVPENMDNIPEIHHAFEIANEANLTRDELEDLERREQFIYGQQGAIALGREEEREEGMREKAIAIARQLLDRLDDETISQTTGLSVDEVKNLRS
jgi:predicted transposase/invertase (TIGR01784 family)